jgi:hypothetical protein
MHADVDNGLGSSEQLSFSLAFSPAVADIISAVAARRTNVGFNAIAFAVMLVQRETRTNRRVGLGQGEEWFHFSRLTSGARGRAVTAK